MVRSALPPSMPRAPAPPPAGTWTGRAAPGRTIQAAELEEMFGDVAVTVARLRAEGIEPRAVALHSGGLDGVSGVLGLPAVRLVADSPVKWGVIV